MTQIITTDNFETTISQTEIQHINLLKNIKKLSKEKEQQPLKLLITKNDIINIKKYIALNPKIIKENFLECELVFEKELILMLKNLSGESLISLTNAANYMEIIYLLEACAFTVAERMKNKSTNELKQLFNIDCIDQKNKNNVQEEFGWMSMDEE